MPEKDLPREILSLEMRMHYGKPEENLESEERIRFVSLEEFDIGIENIESQDETIDYRYESGSGIWLRIIVDCSIWHIIWRTNQFLLKLYTYHLKKMTIHQENIQERKSLKRGYLNRKNLSTEEIHVFSMEWDRIEHEGKHLRILKDGKIISKGLSLN